MRTSVVDFSTLSGITIALGFVGIAIYMGGNVKSFYDLPAVLIVIFGTFSLTAASFSFKEMFLSQRLILKTIFYSSEDPSKSAIKALEVAEIARKKGLLGLQNYLDMIKHSKFFLKGTSLAIDGMPPEEIEKVLVQDINSMIHRHNKSSSILKKAGEISPAMGLIGTLVGLVQMLGQLNDPSSIGPAMSIALLTTFYGAVMAYMIFLPLATKLERNTEYETLILKLYLKSVVSIAKKENPRALEVMLNSILPPAKRVRFFT